MKKSTPRRRPHKLVLRGEAIALLTPVQLDHVAGASQLQTCTIISYDELCDNTTTA